MATRRKTTEETPVTDFDFSAVQATPATSPVVKFKDNPLQKWVADSIAGNYPNGDVDPTGYIPLEITVPKTAEKQAMNMLRRAALPVYKGGLDCGLRLVSKDLPDGKVLISFQAKPEKKKRTYTTAQVRAWAVSENISQELIYPRVTREVSEAYRIAHGLQAAE